MNEFESRATAKAIQDVLSLVQETSPLTRKWANGEKETWVRSLTDLVDKIGKAGRNLNTVVFFTGEVLLIVACLEIAHTLYMSNGYRTKRDQERYGLLRYLRSSLVTFRNLTR